MSQRALITSSETGNATPCIVWCLESMPPAAYNNIQVMNKTAEMHDWKQNQIYKIGMYETFILNLTINGIFENQWPFEKKFYFAIF